MHLSQARRFADQAERRSQGYWLLAKLFLEVPTPDRLQALQTVLAPLSEAPGPLQPAIAELFAAVGQALQFPEATAVSAVVVATAGAMPVIAGGAGTDQVRFAAVVPVTVRSVDK